MRESRGAAGVFAFLVILGILPGAEPVVALTAASPTSLFFVAKPRACFLSSGISTLRRPSWRNIARAGPPGRRLGPVIGNGRLGGPLRSDGPLLPPLGQQRHGRDSWAAGEEEDGSKGWGGSAASNFERARRRTSSPYSGAAVDPDIKNMQLGIASLGSEDGPKTIDDYNAIMKLCATAAKSGAGQLAVTNGIFLLLEIKKVGLQVNDRTFGFLMDTCAKAAAVDEAHKVCPTPLPPSPPPSLTSTFIFTSTTTTTTTTTYSEAMCNVYIIDQSSNRLKTRNWMMQVMQMVIAEGIRPNVVIYSGLIHTIAKAAEDGDETAPHRVRFFTPDPLTRIDARESLTSIDAREKLFP